MSGNLPGRRRFLDAKDNITCEYSNSSWWECLEEVIGAGVASPELLSRYALGADYRCDKPAIISVQGETDSFGYEQSHYCDQCHTLVSEIEKHSAVLHADDWASCDWCKKETTQSDIRPMRDFEEGSSGPVYEVCSACRKRHIEYMCED